MCSKGAAEHRAVCFKKNLNASRCSEHPPVRKMSKRCCCCYHPFVLCVVLYLSRYILWTLQVGSQQEKGHITFLLRYMPSFLSREGFSPPFPSSTVKSNFVYPRHNSRSPRVGHDVRENHPSSCDFSQDLGSNPIERPGA